MIYRDSKGRFVKKAAVEAATQTSAPKSADKAAVAELMTALTAAEVECDKVIDAADDTFEEAIAAADKAYQQAVCAARRAYQDTVTEAKNKLKDAEDAATKALKEWCAKHPGEAFTYTNTTPNSTETRSCMINCDKDAKATLTSTFDDILDLFKLFF